jgi:hypothetical protein
LDAVAGSPRTALEQWERLDRCTVGVVGPPRRRKQWERLDFLEQWGLIALTASTVAYSLPPSSTTSVSLETGAAVAAALDQSRRVLRHGLLDLDVLRELEERAAISVPWHTAPRAVDKDEDEWWERERAAPKQGELT